MESPGIELDLFLGPDLSPSRGRDYPIKLLDLYTSPAFIQARAFASVIYPKFGLKLGSATRKQDVLNCFNIRLLAKISSVSHTFASGFARRRTSDMDDEDMAVEELDHEAGGGPHEAHDMDIER